mgnify:FL=1
MEKICRLIFQYTLQVANTAARPVYQEMPLDVNVAGMSDRMAPPQNKKPVMGITIDLEWKEPGCRILEVVSKLPADQSGLKPGDVITKVDAQLITTPQDLFTLLGTKKPWDEINILVSRDRQSLTFKINLAGQPEGMSEQTPNNKPEGMGGMMGNLSNGATGEILSPEESDIAQQETIKTIEKVRGLKFKEPVNYQILPFDKFEAALKRDSSKESHSARNVPGFYRWTEKTLYLQEAPPSAQLDGVRIHETFHALQDQLFNLEKLHLQAKTTDADNAIRALIEGDATLMFIECLPNSKAGVMIEKSPLEMMGGKIQYDNSGQGAVGMIQRSFDYSIAAKFVKAIKEKKGWAGVNALYTNLPGSTEQILHPEKYLSQEQPIDVKLPNISRELGGNWRLSGVDVQGEFEIYLNLLSHSSTGPKAADYAAGWAGDYVMAYENNDRSFVTAKTVWDTPKDSLEFFEGSRLLLAEKFPQALQEIKTGPENSVLVTWTQEDQTTGLYFTPGERSILLIGQAPASIFSQVFKLIGSAAEMIPSRDQIRPESKEAQAIAALQQMTLTKVYDSFLDLNTYEIIDFDTLVQRLKNIQVIYVGENHINPDHHLLQLNILKALYQNNRKVALGMEFLKRANQTDLDDFTAQKISFQEVTPRIKGGFSTIYQHYEELLKFAGENKVKLVGLSAPDELENKLRSEGRDKLTEEEKKLIAQDIDTGNPDHKRYVINLFQPMMAGGVMDQNQKIIEQFYIRQCIRDETMGESVANYLKSQSGNDTAQIIIIAGNGHVEYKFTIPDRAAKRFPMQFQTIIPIDVDSKTNFGKLITENKGTGDFISFCKPIPVSSNDQSENMSREKKPLLGITLNPDRDQKGCQINEVVVGLPAARAGLQAGDVIIKINENLINNQDDLQAFLKTKKTGDEVTILALRGMEQIKLNLKLGE